jgi:hypothetical protein
LLDKVTVVFVAGAAVRLTVHVAEPGVATLAGLQLRFESDTIDIARTVKTVDRVTPDELADIVAELTAVTALVATVNLAVDRPAGTVTWFGVTAQGLLLDNVTVVPPEGATSVSPTVQSTETPPIKLARLHDTEKTPGWVIDDFVSSSEKLRELPSSEAQSVALVFPRTADALAVKVALLRPDETTTDGGTVA